MKHIYIFLCLFLISGVLSTNAKASDPDYLGDCVSIIKYSYTDFVLWNNKLPDTESWTPHCWPLVYHEDGKWYFDIKRYGEILLQRDQARKRMALRWSPENNKKRLWAEQRIVHQVKYGKYNSW